MPIRLLPEDLVKKIAAGEVIERPASCVKELVENSLDAGAGKISVHLERGGHQMIRIVDDGTGIPPDDLRLSVKHHATSKIASLEDMERIRTLGFRGEALASMAQVARLTVVSRVPGEEMGCQIVVEGGEEKDFGRIGSRKGTEVRVENLFFNTPARKKFLRKESTELKSVLKLVTELALFNHGKAFEVMSNGKEIFSVRSRPTAEERIGEILGEDVQESLVVFEKELPAVRIKGFLSSQERMQRTHQYFFVNGRPVYYPFLSRAVNDAFREFHPGGGYPLFFITFEIDPALVDCNVHPAKREVRFSREGDIYRVLASAVRSVLGKKEEFISEYKYDLSPDRSMYREQEFAYSGSCVSSGENLLVSRLTFPEKDKHLKFLGRQYVILGQVFSKYILFSSEAEVYIMDQHTAAERLRYEDLKKMFSEGELLGQKLLLEEKVTFRPEDYVILDKNRDILNELGMDWEEFGPGIIKLKSIPALLPPFQARKLLQDLVVFLEEKGRKVIEAVYDDIFKMIACRSAVKAGDSLNPDEIESLVCRVLQSKSIYCPHGRPVLIKIKEENLDKFFERT